MNGKDFLHLVLALSITIRVYGLDRTLTPGEQGSGGDVVRAVISKIETTNCTTLLRTELAVAPFMRTMAYVETGDGAQLNAIGGGIWNVSEANFMRTQNNPQVPNRFIKCLQQESSQNHIGPLNWTSLTYTNLSIPLYSGLAVRMLVELSSGLPTPPMYPLYWNTVFKNSMSSLSEWNAGASSLADDEVEVCRLNTDLVFVLDESGSIGRTNFQQVKTFVYNFSSNLLTDTTMNRVGVITFSSGAREHIALNVSNERDQLLQRVNNITYSGGGTNTALGLELMLQQDWRDDISVLRLAIVLTDGMSNNQAATLAAAEAVHAHEPPIVVYSIGVGGRTDQQELEAIASDEEFVTHLVSFDPNVLESTREAYSYQICFTATPEVTVSTPEEGTIGLGVTSRLRYTAPVAEGLTFRLCLRNGHIIIYASTLPNPSSALYDRRETVRASAHPITCLTMFYEFGSRSTSEENRRRKRQLPPTETFSLYITLEGQDDINDFIFNSSIGNVSLDVDECQDEPCDPNAECYNTDGYFYCVCFNDFTGNGTLCTPVGKTDHEEMSEVVIVSVTVAVICIVIIIVIVNTAILCLVFTGKRKQKFDKTWILSEIDGPPEFPNEGEKEQQKDDNTQLLPETEGPLEFPDEEERMFEQKESLGCQRFVPAMVELYENIASGAVKPEDLLDEQAENVITRID